MDEATKIKKLKEAERGTAKERGGCGRLSLIIGLALIIGGLFYASEMQGKTLRPNPTPLYVAETAVSQRATPTLAPTATATASATSLPTGTAAAVATRTPLPTQTPYPTYTPYPSATWTAQPTFTPQATWTAEPTHTAQPTYTPFPTATETAVPAVATAVPFLAPPAVQAADPPDGGSPLPTWLPWLVGSLVALLLVALVVLAYVSHQMRPPTPVLITPEGIPVDGTYGVRLPPPDGQPVRETPSAPVPAPVTPVSPPEVAPVQNSTQRGQGAPPETIQVSVTDANPDTDVATMTALCTAWNEIAERGEQPSLNKLCVEYFGGKNSERLAIARRAVRWGRGNGLIGNKNQKEVNPDEPTTKTTERRSRHPIPVIGRRGGSVLN
jgi:hypothetical protein